MEPRWAYERRFFWDEIEDVVASVPGDPVWTLADGRDHWLARTAEGEVRLWLPLVTPVADDVRELDVFLARLPEALGLHLVVVMQAGAASLGLFEEGQPLATRTIKKYVVRGSGKAQRTHLASKGKSRYGSRLRLRNAKSLEADVHAKLSEWFALHGAPESYIRSCPIRLWSDFIRAASALPVVRKAAWIRIPQDLPVPTTEVMTKAYRAACQGRLERRDPAPDAEREWSQQRSPR